MGRFPITHHEGQASQSYRFCNKPQASQNDVNCRTDSLYNQNESLEGEIPCEKNLMCLGLGYPCVVAGDSSVKVGITASVLTVAISALVLAGCSASVKAEAEHPASPVDTVDSGASTAYPSDSLHPDFIDFIDELKSTGELSDLQLEILSDYWVTDAELERLTEVEQQCMEPLIPEGLTYTMHLGSRMWIDDNDEFEEVIHQIRDACGGNANGAIRMLHRNMATNPDLAHPLTVYQRCLVAAGVQNIDNLTLEEFAAALTTDAMMPYLAADGCGAVEIEAGHIVAIIAPHS